MTQEEQRNADFAANPGFSDYLATMLQDLQYTESDHACEDQREARDTGTIYTLPAAAYDSSLADWRAFTAANADDIAAALDLIPGEEGFWSGRVGNPMNWERIGSTLWLDRTGSGVSFTDDGDAPCLERLSAAADALGTVEPYLGDNGEVYL